MVFCRKDEPPILGTELLHNVGFGLPKPIGEVKILGWFARSCLFGYAGHQINGLIHITHSASYVSGYTTVGDRPQGVTRSYPHGVILSGAVLSCGVSGGGGVRRCDRSHRLEMWTVK